MKKTLSAIFATAFLLVVVGGVFSLSASAAVNPAYSVKVCDTTSPLISDTSPALININGYLSCFFTTDPDVPLVMCPWNSGSPNNNVGSANCVAVSTDPDALLYSIRYRTDGTIYSSAVLRPLDLTFVSGGVIYYYFSLVGNSGEYCYPIDSMPTDSAGAISACVAALNYTPGPEPSPSPSLNDGGTNLFHGSYPISVVVPAGYVLCVEGDLGSIRFDQSFDDYSALYQVSGYWWWGSSAFTRDSSSIPIIGSSYSISQDSSSRIPFLKADPKNFAGQSRNGYFQLEFNNAGPYLLIFNPQINWYNDHGLADTNHDLTVTFLTFGSVDTIRAFPISCLSDFFIGDSSLSCVISGDPYYLSLSGLWRDPTQSSNLVSLPSSQSGDEQTSVLDGLVSDIDSLVSGVWSHVRTLVDVLGQFPRAIIGIYSWLPSDYKAVLFSLFAITCSVGVVKVLV